jgi:hypothetical protein
MQGFKSPEHAQHFLSRYGPIAQHFRPRRHLQSASGYRTEMEKRCESWSQITGTERDDLKVEEAGRGTRLPAAHLRLNNLTKPSSVRGDGEGFSKR